MDTLDELIQTPEGAELIQTRATELAQAEQRRIHVVEFARRVSDTVSEIQGPRLAEIMLSMPADTQAEVERLFTLLLNHNLVDFASRGHGKILSPKKQLQDEYKPMLWEWIKSGKTAPEWFAVNPEVGKAEDFDLAEFSK